MTEQKTGAGPWFGSNECDFVQLICCQILRKHVRMYSNLPVTFATQIWAVCANLCGKCKVSSLCFQLH